MRRQLGVAITLLFWAVPVLAHGAVDQPSQSSGRGRELAALPPMAPLLPATEGADDVSSGGGAIIRGALLGGLAGGLVGLGLGLLQGNNYGRDIAIGAGAGLIVGGVLGATRALGDRRALPEGELASFQRDPVIQGRTIRVGGQF